MATHACDRGNDVWLSVLCEGDEEVDTAYRGLSAGGRAVMPLHDAFWGARFAMRTDCFGFNWMFNYERPKSG